MSIKKPLKEIKQAPTLASWKRKCKDAGLRTKKVSVSKSRGEYWQAIHPALGIVGFYLTGGTADKK